MAAPKTGKAALAQSKATKDARKRNVIQVLNMARAMELKAISQYMNQHYKLDDKDLGELAGNMKLIAIDEMRHAEMFAERIKELGGEPTTDLSGKVVKGQDIKAIHPFDVNEEDVTIDAYNQFLVVCRENGDSITAKLFEQIIDEEQIHLNYFDNVADHIATMGDAYLSRIAGTSASTGPSTKSFVLKQSGGA
ncbi:MAG: ferritin-like domain-containing protein [Desulfovibrionaceae bacterium]